ncbi:MULTISPECIES: hypothetical protein [Streptomyces]|uniref:hypothetical protein n=1 Tax=Streptomyces TaxID=1883 RepID=UPI001180EFDA|nr:MULTISPECIES: hypothetical protein [Streptomyces]MDX3584989.1 hypothetical protein [Streptomyces europaeiscabiei]MDX3615075.1 hypothetical protein [Streptomyces europaeiscabiei]MDX3635163.1 hypothetical protein [Streptomyces europaeiscabiei]MDX3650147.1 hypothetical protein [Streptomyces europaeiscabiei]WUD37725.1 hypothetical protein OG858_44160 [Streptomyces europaeiscabiei]
MARGLLTVPRRGDLGPAAVMAVLLAVLTALLLPSSYGSTAPRTPDHVASATEAVQAAGGTRSDDGHCAALLRSPRDVPGERLSPPSTATVASSCTPVGPPTPVHTASPVAVSQPASPHSTGRHQGRAPPPPPGT